MNDICVVVPCFNHESYVEACISSVMQQEDVRFRLLVIDDGSSDNSAAIIEGMRKRFDFTFICRPNKGLCPTLNEALAQIAENYYCVIASDDMLLPGALRTLKQYLDTHPDAAAVGGSVIKVSDDGAQEGRLSHGNETLTFDDIFKRRYGPNAPGALIRTQAAKMAGSYKDSCYFEDLYLWLKIAVGGWKLASIDSDVALYRQHPLNMHRNSKRMTQGLLDIYEDYRANPMYGTVVSEICYRGMKKAIRQHDIAFANTLFKRALPHKPFDAIRTIVKANLLHR